MLDKVYRTEQQALKDQFHPPPDFLPEIKIQGQSVGSQNPSSNLKPLNKYLSMPIMDQGDLKISWHCLLNRNMLACLSAKRLDVLAEPFVTSSKNK